MWSSHSRRSSDLHVVNVCSIEDVADDSPSPFWFQLYVMRDRNFMSRLIERARDAKCSALMVTLDLQILAQRHKDVRNGLSAPPKLTLRNILSLMQKPAWCLRMLSTKRRQFGNIVGHVEGVKDMSLWLIGRLASLIQPCPGVILQISASNGVVN